MDTYLLMLLVTSEQEQVIRFLFEQRGWRFMKTGSRPPSKEELDYLYENIVPEKQSDVDFRNIQPYLQLGYLEHLATQRYPAITHDRPVHYPAITHDRSERYPAITHHRPEMASFSRTPSLVYAVHDFNRVSSSGQLFQSTDGASPIPASSDLPVQASGPTSVPSEKIVQERSHAMESSVSCISKSLTILENIGTGQYDENIVTEIEQNSMQKESLINLNKTAGVSFSLTQSDQDSTLVVNDETEGLTVTMSSPVEENVMSKSCESPAVVLSIEATSEQTVCGMNEEKDNDTIADHSIVTLQDTTISEQSNQAHNYTTCEGKQPKMMFLKSIEDFVSEEYKDALKDCSIDIMQVGQKVCDMIMRELGKRGATSRDCIDHKMNLVVPEKQVVHENTDVTQEENCSGDDIDEDLSQIDGVQLRNKVPREVMNTDKSQKHPKHSNKSTKMYVMKDTNVINQDSELKSNADSSSTNGKLKPAKVYKARKHRWTVSRNIRMHRCHRKVLATPADLDASSYSVSEHGYFCGACMFVFRTSRQLGLHRELKGGLCSPDCLYCDKDNFQPDIHQCESCHKCFKTRDLLDRHAERHKLQHHTCEFCDAKFNSTTELKLHVQSKHSEKFKGTHLCDLCGAKFNETKVLNAHRKYVHTDERPEICKTCGSRFKTKSQLKNHMIKHKKLEDINLSCEVCGKLFLRVATLKDHVRRHKKEFLLYCPVCGKGFYRKYGLEEHMRGHTGSRPFSCSQCTYKCSLKCNLIKHMKTHTHKVT